MLFDEREQYRPIEEKSDLRHLLQKKLLHVQLFVFL